MEHLTSHLLTEIMQFCVSLKPFGYNCPCFDCEREKGFSKHLVSSNEDQTKCECLIFLEQEISKFQVSSGIVAGFYKVLAL